MKKIYLLLLTVILNLGLQSCTPVSLGDENSNFIISETCCDEDGDIPPPPPPPPPVGG